MKLLKPGASYTPFEDAIVLLRVDVEGLLVERWIVLDLVDMGLRLTLVAGVGVRLRLCLLLRGLVVKEDAMGGGRDGRRRRRLVRGRLARLMGRGLLLLLLLLLLGVEVVEVGLMVR